MSDAEGGWGHVLAPDTEDVRLFIELVSHGRDLTAALHALELAREAERYAGALPDVQPYLIEAAVIAYCRAAGASNVRKPLTELVAVPPELRDTHDLIWGFRNTTVAHSQSDLVSTLAVVPLEPVTRHPRRVIGITGQQYLPPDVLARFEVLVEAMTDQLDELIGTVRERIDQQVANAPLEEVWGWPPPTFDGRLSGDFDPRTRRAPRPLGLPVYWSAEG